MQAKSLKKMTSARPERERENNSAFSLRETEISKSSAAKTKIVYAPHKYSKNKNCAY